MAESVGGMSQSEFERLVWALGTSRHRLTSARSLLEVACHLLDADAAVLLEGEGRSPATVDSFSRTGDGIGSDHIEALKSTELLTAVPSEGQGFAVLREGGAAREVLVAYGRKRSDLLPFRRLVLLRAGWRESPWNSYHTWAAAFLLEEHDLHLALGRGNELKSECKRLDADARSLGRAVKLRVLRDESWTGFVGRAKSHADGEEVSMLREAALWTAYRARDSAVAVKSGGDRLEGGEAPDTALLSVKPLGGSQGKAHDPWQGYMEWAVWTLGAGSGCGDVPKSARAESGVDPCVKLDAFLEDAADTELLAITLEHGWRLVRDGATGAGIAMETLVKCVNRLLDATCRLAAGCLQEAASPAKEGDRHAQAKVVVETPLGRHELRLYFVLLLGGSKELRNRYLSVGATIGPRVADHARRSFIRSLARFLLAVVTNVEERRHIDTTPSQVSAAELLDSLLFLVDRYAHVGLGVDDALEIQKLLAHGLTAEVEHHLGRLHYRDHLIHVIDVFLLGHILLDTELSWHGDKDEPLEANIARMVLPQGAGRHWHREWAVASLLHDLGYQAWTEGESNRTGKNGFFRVRRGPLPDWLCPETEGSPGKLDRSPVEVAAATMIKEFTQPRGTEEGRAGSPPLLDPSWLPSDASETLPDHGVLSALRVAQLLLHAGSAGIPGRDALDGSRLAGCAHALHAIAHHNRFNQRVSLGRNPLACLLRLCDELQEWGRRRVDIEQTVKGLYLSIEGEGPDGFPRFESLDQMYTNLCFETVKREGKAPSVRIFVREKAPVLAFRLGYRNPIEASFDPIYTLLSKAYNLQALDLRGDRSDGQKTLRIELEFQFPLPREYGSLTEYDVYGMYAERLHGLPVLTESETASKAPPGLAHLRNLTSAPGAYDRFSIVIEGEPGEARKGWLPLDPMDLLEGFLSFRKALLGNPDGSRGRL